MNSFVNCRKVRYLQYNLTKVQTVKYLFGGSVEEDLFLCAPLETNTTGEEIFGVVDSYMREYHINWNKCIDMCSDRASAIIGKIKITATRINEVAPICSSGHCVLHRYTLP